LDVVLCSLGNSPTDTTHYPLLDCPVMTLAQSC